MDHHWSFNTHELKRQFPIPAASPLPPPDPRFVHGPPELCQLAATAKVLALGPDWVMEEKHDGVRLLWKGGALLTREGEPATFAEHLRPDFERLERRCGQPMFFDSEYTEASGFHATLAAVGRGEGAGVAHVFACLPLDAWQAGKGGGPDLVRRHFLEAAFGEWEPDGLRLVVREPATSAPRVEEAARAIWARGGEGLMLKNRQAPYVRGRTSAWLKVKRKVQLEATVVDVPAGKAVAVVEFAGKRHRIPCQRNVKAGDRVTVEAMEWTDKGRLRQPRIVGKDD